MAACLDHPFAPGKKSDKNALILLLFLMDGNKLYEYVEASILRLQDPLCCVKLDSLYMLYLSVSESPGSSTLILTMLFLSKSKRSSYLAVWLAVPKLVHRIHLHESPTEFYHQSSQPVQISRIS